MQGAALSSLSNRISYVFGLHGPSLTVDTACSSSLVALHLACEALHRGDITTALVGGVNLLLTPQAFIGFARASMLSRRGRCHAFDARADGYVRAEGGGVLVLKPLDRALADGDAIRAVIRGTGVNSDGRTNGFSLPNGAAQAALLRRVYAEAGIEPDEISYFEAHGTGTPAGDPIEAAAIGAVLGRRRGMPLPIGSVKSNIGHLEPASGMAGLIKVILAFDRGIIPPSLHFETPNPNIPFADINLEVVATPRPLVPGRAGLLAGINSFGFGGTNAHAILAAPPLVALPTVALPAAALPAALPPPGPEQPIPLLVSARSAAALRELAQTWHERLADAVPVEVPGLLRGAARRREQHAHRLVVTAGDGCDMAARLDDWLAGATVPGVVTGESTRGALAFVFSGNGSQWAGMAGDALALSPAFSAGLAAVDAHLAAALGWSVAERLAAPDLAEALRDTAVAQPLLFAIQVACVMALREAGIVPSACVGHSAGEVAAAWACGALTLEQACIVIARRSAAQQKTRGTGVMAALGLDAESAEALFAQEKLDLAIAAYNGARAVTVAGPEPDMRRLGILAAAQEWPFTRLDLDFAFHSQAMEPIHAPLLAALAGVTSAAPAIEMISTVTGRKVGAGDLDADYWWRNVRQPVRFTEAASALVDRGARVFLEIGPQPVLLSFLCEALDRAGQAGRALGTLSRARAATDPFPPIAAACHVAGASIVEAALFDGSAAIRELPAYPWQHTQVEPNRTIERIELLAPQCDHPLLGFRERLPADAWLSHLSVATDPWLADHRVDGVVVLPAAAMIEMTLAAARARHHGAAALEIHDLEIVRSLVLEPNAVRDCRLTVAEDGRIVLESRPRLSDEARVPHATGRILAGAGATPLLSRLKAGDEAETFDAAHVYAAAERLHLQYGPQFRTVTAVHRLDARHGVAELTSRAPGRAAPSWLLDPALVDGSLQALLVLMADTLPAAAQGAVVPWRFGRIRLLRPQGGQPSLADLHVRHVGPRSVCADIALRDATGELIAELLDCWFVAIHAGRAAGAADRTFWTAYVPGACQPLLPAPDLLNAVLAPFEAAPGERASVLLADACAAALAFEALAAQADAETGMLPPTLLFSPVASEALGWLEQDGLAMQTLGAWRLMTESDLPPATEIWRSLFFDTPRGTAECALLAAFGDALADGQALASHLPDTLRTQILFGSPSGAAAQAALLRGLDTVAERWPAGRCLRVGVTGSSNPALLRRIADTVTGHAISLRLLVLGQDAEALDASRDTVAQIPGAAVKAWADLAAADGHGCDVVLDLYGLSLPDAAGLAPAALIGLLAPGGLLLSAEPEPSRLAGLVFGGAGSAALRPADTWCAVLRDEGCTEPRAVALEGALWPVALVAAVAPMVAGLDHPSPDEEGGLVVFAAPGDPLAEALSARQAALRRLPVEALKDALAAPFTTSLDHLLILGPSMAGDGDEADRLAALLADIGAAMMHLPEAGPAPRLWLVAHGAPGQGTLPAALAGLRRVVANEVPGLDCRTIGLDAVLPPDEAAGRVLAELTTPDPEREVWLTEGGRLVPRLRRHLPPPSAYSGPRRLEATHPGLISSLAWLPMEPRTPGAGEVAISVRAAALNFRDVMWAQGLLPDEALLAGFSGPSLGLECAGIVTAVGPDVDDFAPGDRVIAVAPAALATEVVTPRNGVMRMPGALDFAEAATIPVAFMTVVYALGHLARLEPGERVLIHGGAGGVGLAAIQYALHCGAEVYATAGSQMRRQMLRQLGVAGAFDSRSTQFADDVLAATGGEGVDVVLNSLSGELMRQSLRLLRPFGRFLEIGKRDLYGNTPIGIRPLRHNISYFAIDSDELVGLRPAVGQAVLDEVAALLDEGRLRPLPYRSFGFTEAVDAFRLMQSSGHIGKLVLLPEPTIPLRARPDFTADADGVYVVSGGLAGFGLQAAQWLARHGARRLALIGRRGPDTPGAGEALAGFASQGVRAEAFACDVTDEAALAGVLAQVRDGLGPIRGVLHAAMVLDDAFLKDLDAARFAMVIRPKLAGAVALDRLTRGDALDLFVLFSSVTTVIGTPGQAAYVAANVTLEALARRRHEAGLPALAVQWGPIGDAGYLVRQARVGDMLSAMLGAAPLGAAEALDALPGLLACEMPVVGLADAAWGELRTRLPGLAGPFWDEMPATARGDASGESVRTRLAVLSSEEATREVLEILRQELGAILKQSPATLDVSRPVLDFGVDSLMAIELRTALELRLGMPLPLMLLSGGFTLSGMAARLTGVLLQGDEGTVSEHELAASILRHEGEAAVAEALD